MRPMRRLLPVCALAATTLGAQQSERSTFYLTVGQDTLTVERVERSPGRLVVKLLDMRTRSRVDLDLQLAPTAEVAATAMRVFAAERDSTPALAIDARFLGDSVGVTRAGTTNWIRVGRGALPNVNPSAALLEQSIRRSRAIGGDSVSIPLMYLPNGPTVPVTIVRRGADSVTVRIGSTTILAAVSNGGALLGAVIPAQNARYLRGPEITGNLPGAKDYGPPPGAPYSAQDVSIRTPAGITLRGTLTLPQRGTGAKSPAIVTITGSGPQDRDSGIRGLQGYRPFYQLADTLGRRGIAVLRLDDRGSGSDAGPSTVTSADFADDIRAAVAWLRSRPEIDGKRIGLVGHSEGGMIAPMVASSDTALAAVVIMAGTVSKGREIITFQQRFVIDSMAHLVGQQRDAALAQYARNTDSVAATMPWMKFFLDYDGRPAAARVRAPVLILHGEKDYQVPVAEAEKTAAAIRSGGNRDVTVRVFPGTNHLFLPDGGVGFSYEKLPAFVVKPEIIGAIADWLALRLKP